MFDNIKDKFNEKLHEALEPTVAELKRRKLAESQAPALKLPKGPELVELKPVTEGSVKHATPQAPSASVRSETLSISCPGCGAVLRYSAGLGAMTCRHCEAEVALPDKPVFGNSLESALDELFKMEAGAPLPPEKLLACGQCGAATSVEGHRISGRCAFCASEMVKVQDLSPNKVVPSSLIPFKVERQKAAQAFSDWTGGLWFRPNALKSQAKVEGIEGVYVPFWTFDAKTQSVWEAERGDHYYEEEQRLDSEGKTETVSVKKTRWSHCGGEHGGEHDDLLICGSRGLTEELLKRVEPYNTKHGLVPYEPRFLSGWIAEEYQVGPQVAWAKGKEEIEHQERLACDSLVPGDTHRGLEVSTTLESVTWKHVLLPVWIAAYQYNGKSYRFLVNGETGKVSGESPLSWTKISAAILALYLIILLVARLVVGAQAFGIGTIFKSTLGLVLVLGSIAISLGLRALRRSSNPSYRAFFELFQQFR